MRLIGIIGIVLLLIGCSSKGSDPSPPEAANLVFPEQNSECTTGISQSDTTSEVEFRWQAADNTDTYELRVTHLLTNITQTRNTTNTSVSLTIDKGAPYSWLVISRNSDTASSASSSTWQFYNAGSQTSYAPFPAAIVSPASGSTVVSNSNGEVMLEWSGADVDNDLTGFDIYHGTTNPPAVLEASTTVGVTNLQVSVQSGTYFWKVVSKDAQGNSSDSGVYSYRVL